MSDRVAETLLAGTDIAGLDDILGGGLVRNRLYLVEGVPGSGKTTLAMQFLMAGAARGEPVLYVSLSETEEELRSVAASHGWDMNGVEVRELTPSEADLDPEGQNTMFHPSEVELAETTRRILADVQAVRPTRVVFDSLSELRLLAGSALRYRRQILAFKQFFATRDCTVMLLDDMTASDHDLQVQSIAHAVILLEQLNPEYGSERRRLRIVKYRGVRFRGGYHDYLIQTGGLTVFPRLVAAEHRQVSSRAKISSEITELDDLLGGGIEEGTSTLVVGAAGTGKSSLAAQFAVAAAARGIQGALFLFDESMQTLVTRCTGLQIDLASHVDSGQISLKQVDPAEFTPGELIHAIRHEVEVRGARVIVIDSLNGYLNAMPEERFLIIQLHELLMYLSQRGVATILIGAHQGLIGSQMNTPVDASYLADAVLLIRYFEAEGEVRQAISVMKKRGSRHERTIREFRLDSGRIKVGEVLREFRGVLTGVPEYRGPRPDPRSAVGDDGVDLERRVLLLAPTAKDAGTAQGLLASVGLSIERCGSFDGLMAELERGAAAILLPEEALSPERASRLSEWLTRQPPWSDLPVLILARTGANSAASREAERTLGNVTLLERPLQVATLVSAVRTALRARERQWQIRGYLAERVRAEESLRQADQRKDEFLATLGHELRNPLAPLMTGLQLLNTSAAGDPQVRDITVIMNRQLRHLVRLVDDLLEVSRITRGLVDIEREPVDLGFVLRSAVDTSQPALDAAGHTLSVDLPDTPVTVAGDAVRLTQVFSNLLTNAAKYTNAGGHVSVTLERRGSAAVVSVKDDGIGISSEHLGSVFEMFVQVDRSNRRAQGGLGIGLTLVRSLVTLHGGTVEARSGGPGRGTEFVVELPVLSATVASARDLEPAGPFPPCRVLIVDDNCDAADTLGSLLAEAGVTVSVAHTGPDALRILPEFGPDVVLLDIGMPDMDGYAVARYIRSTPGLAAVRIIALTGWGQDQDVQQARDAGFDHHLVKPPNMEKLRLMLLTDCPPQSATSHRSTARA